MDYDKFNKIVKLTSYIIIAAWLIYTISITAVSCSQRKTIKDLKQNEHTIF